VIGQFLYGKAAEGGLRDWRRWNPELGL